MRKFTQPELLKAVRKYLRDRDKLVADAITGVTKWRYANDPMFSPMPLYDLLARGSNQWKAAKRKWFKKEPSSFWYKHGIDDAGNVRLIESKNGFLTLFVYAHDMIDEMRFGSHDHRGTFLRRYVLRKGLTQVVYDYRLDPHQYDQETYQIKGGRYLKSINRGWYLEHKSRKWISSSVTEKCTFEYDESGLSRVYRDEGFSSGFKLVYVRPSLVADFKAKSKRRRPFVAYTISIVENPEGPRYCVYCDAYGLEMNIDDEWPIDTVLLAPPSLVDVINNDTGVTSMGTVYSGSSAPPTDGDFKALVAASAKWILIDGSKSSAPANVGSALKAGLNVIICVEDQKQLSDSLIGAKRLSADRIVAAFRPAGSSRPEEGQLAARSLRDELHSFKLGDSRLILCSQLDAKNIMDYLRQPDIDGVLFENGQFTTTLGILSQIAIHC
jgi:hypothetical protein